MTRTQSGRRSAAALCGRAAAALIGLVALAACASSGSSSTPSRSASASSPAASATSTAPVTAPSPSSSPAGSQACADGSLQVRLGAGSGYAGGAYQPIDFTNTSGASCTLYGYPGVSLVSGTHAQIGLAAKRNTTAPLKLITLAPGATGNAQLQIVDALNFPTGTCAPAQAAELRIYPPNQTAAVFLPKSSEGCAQPVQILFVGAVQAGSA